MLIERLHKVLVKGRKNHFVVESLEQVLHLVLLVVRLLAARAGAVSQTNLGVFGDRVVGPFSISEVAASSLLVWGSKTRKNSRCCSQ